MNVKQRLMGCLLLAFGLASASQAQTYILPPEADTTLSQTAPDQNSGADPVLPLNGGRAVLRVDESAVRRTSRSSETAVS